MKNLLLGALVTCCTFTVFAGENKVIYGEDNRVLAHESTNKLFKKLAESTAAMVPASSITYEFDATMAVINGKKLQESMRVCEDERFAQETTAAMCSGFLVGDDLLVTAGHCIRDEAACAGNSWVFNYRSDLLGNEEGKAYVDSENVYKCKEIVSQTLDNTTKNDYALIKLDRKVTGRDVLKVRTEGKIELGTEIVVIGHPSGLPTIIADGAKVRNNDNEFFFQANLDTFGGNSGSAVFDAETGTVEGILVRGERDYRFDADKGCYRVFECKDDECRGEDVTRITQVPGLK